MLKQQKFTFETRYLTFPNFFKLSLTFTQIHKHFLTSRRAFPRIPKNYLLCRRIPPWFLGEKIFSIGNLSQNPTMDLGEKTFLSEMFFQGTNSHPNFKKIFSQISSYFFFVFSVFIRGKLFGSTLCPKCFNR